MATRAPTARTDVKTALEWIHRHGSKKVKDGMARFAIPSDHAVGISVGDLRKYARVVGTDHELALALWQSGVYEARLLATFVDDAALVTPAQMDRWCRDFDSWAVCDTACFALFDRTPHAFAKVHAWSKRRAEFQKRAAFALLSGLSVHHDGRDESGFERGLLLVTEASRDERNFVKKAVNMALRAVGKRSRALNARAVSVARELAASNDRTAQWIGKDAQKELTSASVKQRLARR